LAAAAATDGLADALDPASALDELDSDEPLADEEKDEVEEEDEEDEEDKEGGEASRDTGSEPSTLPSAASRSVSPSYTTRHSTSTLASPSPQ